jgi:hypothetical protein
MFVLTSDITIGKFRFSGVNAVRIKRSIHSIVERATITLPSIGKIIAKGRVDPGTIITGHQFSEGDPVTIKLGYNNQLKTEFRGFVTHRSLKMSLEIECEGYSWLLRRNKIQAVSGTVKLKDLLKNAVSGINGRISVQCDLDIEFSNVNFKDECGFDIIDSLSKYTDENLSFFFIRPDILWCGILYSQYAEGKNVLNLPLVNYRMGYNVIQDNNLKERTVESNPIQVKYSNKLPDGTKISQTSDGFKKYVRTHSKILKQIKDESMLKRLAQEKAYQSNYTGYEGSVNAFLQPYAEPGYQVYFSDRRYPERNGIYLSESTEVSFGISGARRKIEIGPRSGFAK